MPLFCNIATAIHFRTAFISFIRGELMGLQYVSEHPKHGAPGTANYIDARTRWFDTAVQNASKQGIMQIVVIAAGFYSRAYRFHAPGLQAMLLVVSCRRWFVDQAYRQKKCCHNTSCLSHACPVCRTSSCACVKI